LPIENLYTAGPAAERFLRALKEQGVFLASPCRACKAVYCPARHFCERCFARLEETVEVGPEGAIHSFTAVRRDLDGRPLEAPQVLALIRLKGATTVLVHRLKGADPAAYRIGQKVRPVFEPPAARTASILDVRHFESA
jgi:uncharacterized OB-fold protein